VVLVVEIVVVGLTVVHVVTDCLGADVGTAVVVVLVVATGAETEDGIEGISGNEATCLTTCKRGDMSLKMCILVKQKIVIRISFVLRNYPSKKW
jgi:hypothetical protein